MLRKILLLAPFLALCLNTGCQNPREDSSHAYVGGRIVNPTSNQVIFLKENAPLDTILLDLKNEFSYRIENAAAGYYHLKHSPQSHVLYIEPGDSILLRTNSLDFDGSIHFSGKGGEKNNFLADLNTLNALNTELILSFHKRTPSLFTKQADSIKKNRLDLLAARNEKYEFSDGFLEVARKTINFENYDLRERYAYMVNKYYKEHARELTDDFHSYRKEVDFNDISLQTCPSYIRFFENYLVNQSMKECARANLDHNDCYDLYDHHNISSRIRIVDSLTGLPLIKKHFYSKYGVLGIIMARERNEILDMLSLLKEKGYNEMQLEELTDIGRLQLAYLPGMNINQIPVISLDGKEINYEKVTGKPAVIFLWSVYSPKNHQQNHKTIKQLRKKYPEVDFIGINVDPGETALWKSEVSRYGYDKAFEFQLKGNRIRKETFQYYLNKVLLVDASGKVYKGDAYIHSPHFETRILELLNRG